MDCIVHGVAKIQKLFAYTEIHRYTDTQTHTHTHTQVHIKYSMFLLFNLVVVNIITY